MLKKIWIICMVVLGSLLAACSSQPKLTDIEEWDLVLISDSSGWDVANIYAQYIEADLGVKVTVHDYANAPDSAREVLNILNGEKSSSMSLMKLTEVLSDAEVVVFYHNPETPDSFGFIGCVPPAYYAERDPVYEDFAVYESDLEQIYQRIFELKAGQPVAIRAFDAYYPYYTVLEEHGVLSECKEFWELYNQAIHQAADSFGIPVAGVYDAFNGPNHNLIPFENGLIREDRQHTTIEGATLIADLLRQLGYKETKAP